MLPPLLKESILREWFRAMSKAKISAHTATKEMVAFRARVWPQQMSRLVIWSKVSIFKNVKHLSTLSS